VDKYRIYEVTTTKGKPGKGAAAVEWWHKRQGRLRGLSRHQVGEGLRRAVRLRWGVST